MDATAAQIEKELFSLVNRLKWQDYGFAPLWEVSPIICYAVFFHGYQSVGFRLSKVDVRHPVLVR